MPKARPPSPQSVVVGSRRSVLTKTIVIFLLALIVMIGLTFLIIWLTIKPKKPIYSIYGGSIRNYNLSNDYHLSASYNFVLESYNPNKKMTIYYDKMEITIMFKQKTIARDIIDPWHQQVQQKRNATSFKLDLASRNVELSGALSRDLESAKSSNHVVLDVKLKGRIKTNTGASKSSSYHMKVSCVHVVAHFPKSCVRVCVVSKGFHRSSCDVDI